MGWMFTGMLLAKARCKELVICSREKGYMKRHPCDENFDDDFLLLSFCWYASALALDRCLFS